MPLNLNIKQYIYFYNYKRLRFTLGYLTPT
ncbi:MAG: IS3 family transposase [Thiohalomonadales bacterium]